MGFLGILAFGVSKETIQEYASNLATGDHFTKEFTYNVFGRPRTVINGRGNETSYEYDDIGRLKKKTNPGGSTSAVEYFDGNTSSLPTMTATDENGGKIRTTYNRLGYRLIGTTEVSDNFTYDFLGNLTESTAAANTSDSQTTEYRYDGAGRLTWTKNPDNSVYQAAYDWLGR